MPLRTFEEFYSMMVMTMAQLDNPDSSGGGGGGGGGAGGGGGENASTSNSDGNNDRPVSGAAALAIASTSWLSGHCGGILKSWTVMTAVVLVGATALEALESATAKANGVVWWDNYNDI